MWLWYSNNTIAFLPPGFRLKTSQWGPIFRTKWDACSKDIIVPLSHFVLPRYDQHGHRGTVLQKLRARVRWLHGGRVAALRLHSAPRALHLPHPGEGHVGTAAVERRPPHLPRIVIPQSWTRRRARAWTPDAARRCQASAPQQRRARASAAHSETHAEHAHPRVAAAQAWL